MKDRIKAFVFLFLLSLTFYVMIDTHYSYALGDYILESLGLKAWTGSHYSGYHLTLLYFGLLFFIFLHLTRKYAQALFGSSRWKFFMAFVICVTCIHWTSYTAFITMKGNLEGLHAIGLDSPFNASHKNEMHYNIEDKKITTFSANFQLTNYSDEKRVFYICFEKPNDGHKKSQKIYLYDADAKPHAFTLQAKESKPFSLTHNDYMFQTDFDTDDFNISGSGNLSHLFIYDDQGKEVRLNQYDILGLYIHR